MFQALGQGPVATQIGLLTRYLETSRRHLWSALLAARYGVWRLTATILLPILLLVGGLWWWTYRKVESDHVAAVLMRNGLNELSTTTLPVKDRARFLLNVDRLKDHLPWFNFRPEAHYSFPKALNQLNNDTLALDIELNMYACADNSDYDLLERENPYSQAILRDIQTRLAQAGDIAKPANGKAGLSEPQRRRAVLTARYIMALSYYLVCDTQSRPKFLPDPAVHKEERARFAETRQQLLGKLRDYVRQEIQTTTGRAPSPAAFGFCLRVLLGQGTDSKADLAFLDGMSPFEPGSTRQFQRLFPANKITNDEITSLHLNSGGYMAAAMAFAARQNLPQAQRCLAVLRADDFITPWHEDSGIALMPYLVKYKLLTPENARDVLYECAQAGGVGFDEMYAATVYSLLSVKPAQTVFDVSQPSFTNTYTVSNVQLGGIDPKYLNADRVSFSLPLAVRDSAWAALLGATPIIARRDTIFTNPTANDVRRNELFLSAFLAKMHGLYLSEIKHQPAEALQSFAGFSRSLEELQKQPEKGHQVWACHWGLYEYDNGESEGAAVVAGPNMAHPVTYLQLPIRPKTLKYAAYYTCPFDAYFVYELQYAAARDRHTVQLFDSIAFMEAEFPDRFSNEYSTFTSDPLLQSPQYAPNLNWLKAIAKVTVPGDNARTQRNAMLLTIEEAVQAHEQLRDSSFTKKLVAELLPFARQLKAGAAAPTPFMNEALVVAYSDLATAMAHEGQVAQAYALADAIDFSPAVAVYCNYSLAIATRIRIGEQIMLTNNTDAKPLLDAFLKPYLKENQAGHINLDRMHAPPNVAASILPVCFWRPTDTGQPDSIASISPSMTYTLDNEQLMTGLYAPFKGYGLAGKLNQARYEMENSPFRLEPSIRMLNYILLGYAHAVTYKLNDGWREYDEAELTLPSNYSGRQQR